MRAQSGVSCVICHSLITGFIWNKTESNLTIFFSLFKNIQSEKEALKEERERTPKYQRTEDGFIRIGKFQNGIAEGEVDPSFGPLEAMRLSVMTDSPVWVILSEVCLTSVLLILNLMGSV
uniref:MGAT4 A/B/C C-terminal domain-containing protein n=1 Tax=Astyanax mexicanus TaxID=7994 RepID=A0A8B9J757_ASTMX